VACSRELIVMTSSRPIEACWSRSSNFGSTNGKGDNTGKMPYSLCVSSLKKNDPLMTFREISRVVNCVDAPSVCSSKALRSAVGVVMTYLSLENMSMSFFKRR
jgi:hypothetical protein